MPRKSVSAASVRAGTGRKPPATLSSKPKPTRGQDTKAAILKAAVAAFADKGFDGAITRDIAAEAGVGHSLLLYHFKTKELLWEQAIIWLRREYDPLIRELLRRIADDPPARQLWTVIKAIVQFSSDHPEFHRIMLFEGRTGNHRLDWMMQRYVKQSHARYRKLIAECQRAGAVRRGDVSRLRYAIIALATLPVCIPAQYKAITGRDIATRGEIARTLDLIKTLIFLRDPEA